jgi:colicin import membrane protein
MRDIARLTKEVVAKERQLQARQAQNKGSAAAHGSGQQSVRDLLKKKLEEQSGLLAQARRQVEEERKNLDLRIENLKSELAGQELERRTFLLKSAQEDARRKEQQRIDKAAALQKDLKSCQQVLSQKEQEQKELEAAQDARRSQICAVAAEQKRFLLQQRQDMDKIIREAKESAGQQSLQARVDSLLERQQKLLNVSRQVEQDLRRQKEDVQHLLDHSRVDEFKGEKK